MLMKKVCACGCIACANGRGPPKKQKKLFLFFPSKIPNTKTKSVSDIRCTHTQPHTLAVLPTSHSSGVPRPRLS